MWKGRKVMVTGAEGFIGSTLVDLLLERGAEIVAFAHYKPYGDRGFLAGRENDVDIQSGDIRDGGRVSDVMAGCDTVFHLAALIGIPYSYVSPESYVQVNINGTQNILEAVRRNDVRRLVHTSTSEVYGTARTVPISEKHVLQPQSPYSASKIGADMMALSYFNAFETPVAICRPFNTYGPRQSARAVIPAILQQLHSGAQEIKLGSLTPTRDFTFSTDTAEGFLAIGESDAALGQALNLGVGEEISIGDLAKLCIEIVGSDAQVVTDDERLRPEGSEVNRLLSDNSLVGELTGWKPKVSLSEGLRRTSEWILENRDLDTDSYKV